MSQPLDWRYQPSSIPTRGLSEVRRASVGDCAALAAALGVLAVRSLAAEIELKPLRDGRYRLAGRLDADLDQACTVSLEPVAARLSEPFAVEFRAPESIADAAAASFDDVLSGDDIEPIEADGSLDVGRIVFETVAAALDPYPRASGAKFDWEDTKADPSEAGPFAALAKLKRGP